VTVVAAQPAYDLKNAVSANRLTGLWRLMAGYHRTFIGATGALAIAALAKTSTYLLLRYFVDRILGQGNDVGAGTQVVMGAGTQAVMGAGTQAVMGAGTQAVMGAGTQALPLLVVALGFVALALVEGGFTFLSGRLAAQTAEGVTRRLRIYLFDHIQRLTFTYHDHTQTGELIQRSTSDVDAIRRFYADQAIGVGRIILLFAVNFAALLILDRKLALISVVIVPFIIVMSILFFRRISRAYERYQEQEATLSTTLQENLSGVRVVKAFARQAFERDKFERDNWQKFLRGKRLLQIHALYWPSSDLLCGAQMLLGFTVGALMAINGAITVGTYLAYCGLIIWIIWPMRNLGRLIVQTSTGLVSYGRVMEVVSQPREPLSEGSYRPSEGKQIRGEIAFWDVSFEYKDQSPVLHGISFTCWPGQVTALLGSTGSGKTTVVNLLPRFYDYTRGSIMLDGVELRDYPRELLRGQIGIVEQEPFLFSRTIRENITYGVERSVPDDEVKEAARAAAIHDTIVAFPSGYDTLVGEKGVTLSGGQKQRVAIARTLLKNPRILILDDATSSIDTETEVEIREALDRLMEGRTTFIIAHRIGSVMNADQILVLDQGRIVQRGTHAELLALPGIYQQIYDLQARIESELEQEMAGVELQPRPPKA
jgi:ATP-binding cassette subfamily B protein